MQSGELSEYFSQTFDVKVGTVLDYAKELRAHGLLSKGKQGPHAGAHMTSADAVNWMLSLILERPRGSSIADAVRRVRALEVGELGMLELTPGFTFGLNSFSASNAGDALDAVFNDARSGRLEKWIAAEKVRPSPASHYMSNSDPFSLDAQFFTDGRSVFLSLTQFRERATIGFNEPDFPQNGARVVQRSVALKGDLFLQLAKKLGPLN